MKFLRKMIKSTLVAIVQNSNIRAFIFLTFFDFALANFSVQ